MLSLIWPEWEGVYPVFGRHTDVLLMTHAIRQMPGCPKSTRLRLTLSTCTDTADMGVGHPEPGA